MIMKSPQTEVIPGVPKPARTKGFAPEKLGSAAKDRTLQRSSRNRVLTHSHPDPDSMRMLVLVL